MTTAAFASSLRAISERWCFNYLGEDAENLPEDLQPTCLLVLSVMATEQVAAGEEVACHVQNRLDLKKSWDADVVTFHGLVCLNRAGYLWLDDRGLEEAQAARVANKFEHYGVCWSLTEAGAIHAIQYNKALLGCSAERLLEANKGAIARARSRAN